MLYELQFLRALLLTVSVEAAVIVLLLRVIPALKKQRISAGKIIAAGTVPSVATLPYFWFVMPAFVHDYLLRVITGECSIIIVEAVMLQVITGLRRRDTVLLSICANGASILAGLFVFR